MTPQKLYKSWNSEFLFIMYKFQDAESAREKNPQANDYEKEIDFWNLLTSWMISTFYFN